MIWRTILWYYAIIWYNVISCYMLYYSRDTSWTRACRRRAEKGEVLLMEVGTLRYVLILSDNSACQAPVCAAAAWWFDNPRQKVVPRSRIPRNTSHFSLSACLPLLAETSRSNRSATARQPLVMLLATVYISFPFLLDWASAQAIERAVTLRYILITLVTSSMDY